MASELLTIKTAAQKYGKSQVYIRRAIREGDLETQLVPISEGAKTKQHVFTVEAYEEWRASRKHRSHREDGRRKMTFYVNTEEELPVIKEAISKALPDFPVDELLMIANPPKAD